MFWHSSAHVLGEAAERHYGCHLCIGPPTDDGFFYEMAIDQRYASAFHTFSRGLNLQYQSRYQRRLPRIRENRRERSQGQTKVRAIGRLKGETLGDV